MTKEKKEEIKEEKLQKGNDLYKKRTAAMADEEKETKKEIGSKRILNWG